MILGLDISSSRTGWSIVDDQGKLLEYGVFDLTKKTFKDIFDKAFFIANLFRTEFKNKNITHIFIERALYSFKKGKSSAQTIALLQAFNGIISFICCQTFEIKPKFLSAIQARNKVGLKIKRGEKPKPIVLKFLLDTCPEFSVSYTKFGNVAQKHYDEADAIVIAKAGVECLKKKEKY